jgi:hypothetical protein
MFTTTVALALYATVALDLYRMQGVGFPQVLKADNSSLLQQGSRAAMTEFDMKTTACIDWDDLLGCKRKADAGRPKQVPHCFLAD